MSGIREDGFKVDPFIYYDDVYFKFGEFTVVRAVFNSHETGEREYGYAVVWAEDENPQMLTNNVATAVNFAAQSDQSVVMARAIEEQQAAGAETEGLLSEGEALNEAPAGDDGVVM